MAYVLVTKQVLQLFQGFVTGIAALFFCAAHISGRFLKEAAWRLSQAQRERHRALPWQVHSHMPQRSLQIWHPYSQNLRGDKSEMGKSTCSFDFFCVVRLMILYCLLFLSFIELLTYLITVQCISRAYCAREDRSLNRSYTFLVS